VAGVREPLKAPFILLFTLICTTVILTALDVLATWGLYDSPIRAFGLSYVLARAPRSMFEVMVPSTVLSVVLFGLRMARRPFSRFLGLLIVLLVSYVVLVNGMILMRGMSAQARVAPEAPRQYVQPSTLVRVDPWVVSATALSDARLRGVLVFDTRKTADRFSVFPGATATARAGTLTVTTLGAPTVTISGSPALSGTEVFAPDRITGLFLRDVATVSGDFEKLLDSSIGQFFGACFALLFLCSASLALLRVTRWPLANIMLLAVAIRGYFSLYHLLATTLAPRIASSVSDPALVRLFPSAALAALAVVLLLVDILFIPPDRWKREEAA
jgi:hypothetical protein